MVEIKRVNQEINAVEKTIENYGSIRKGEKFHVGVDLGTAYIIMVVLGEDYRPLACEMEFAQVVKDGLVVDFIGAQNIVRRMKEKIEEQLGVDLEKAAIAVPPGTGENDSKTHYYVVEGTGLEVSNVQDEPSAANEVLHIENGAIVDIGGGTTGISILKDGKVQYVYDEATGGTHLTLVLSGRYGISFEEAEELKRNKDREQEVFAVVRPVLEKMATIVKKQIEGRGVDVVYLVGGTCKIKGIEQVFEKELGISIVKPENPILITPVGIAKSDSR